MKFCKALISFNYFTGPSTRFKGLVDQLLVDSQMTQ
jgi:hypothetical protein